MVLLMHPLVFLTVRNKETVRNKAKRKPAPKPTLTTKQIKILSEVMLPMQPSE